jgi:hypothetical protein
MKEPTSEFLTALGNALSEAEHQNVAERMAAGLLWAIYPEWFEQFQKEKKHAG